MILKKKIVILLILTIFFLPFFFPNERLKAKLLVENNFEDVTIPKIAYFNNSMEPIFIDDSLIGVGAHNWTWASNKPWCSGKGLWNDPYVIENLTINAHDLGSPIYIKNSNKYIRIKNCTVYNSSDSSAGIMFENVKNGTVINNNCSNNNIGILLLFLSSNITISNNNISNNRDNGITIENSHNNTISYNLVYNNTKTGIFLHNSNYNNVSRNTVNNNSFGIEYHGIMLVGSDFNNVSWNEVRYNEHYGIYLGDSNNNTISNNLIMRNSHGSIYIHDGCVVNFIKDNTYSNVFYVDPFVIDDDGNGDYTWNQASTQQWWCDGSGTFTNPYVIQNVSVNGHNSSNGITIRNSKGYFRIENCTVYNSNNGIVLDTTSNGTLINNNFSNNEYNGVDISFSGNNTISKNTINNNNGNGIFLWEDNNNNTIYNNTINNNEGNGISLDSSNYNNITGNLLNINQQHGIYLKSTVNNTLSNNIINDCGVFINGNNIKYFLHSIDTSNKVNNKILYYYNNVTNLGFANVSNAGQVILVNVSDSLISNLNVSRGSVGISLNFCNNVTLFNNTASNNNVYGIYLFLSENNNISGNIVNFNKEGLTLLGSNNNNLTDNVVSYSSEYGIYISTSVNSILTGNNMTGCGLHIESMLGLVGIYFYSHNIDTSNLVNEKHLYYYVNKKNLNSMNFTDAGQIYLYNVNKSLISNLNLSHGTSGITLLKCNNITISNITSSYNTKYGVYLFGENKNNTISESILNSNGIHGIFLSYKSNENNITKNMVNDNEGIGIYLDSPSSNNNLYYNDFVDNGQNARDEGSNNAWDDGEIGNYWGDYNGIDTNNDNIGDSNYTIPGLVSANDTRPLMYPLFDDTDGDGLLNLEEYILGNDEYQTNVSNPDSDYDGLSDYWEFFYRTNPWEDDTDSDNMPDLWEIQNSLDANVPNAMDDADSDLLLNLYEYLNGTNPQNPDTDYDSISDYDEILGTFGYITNATNSDTDKDDLFDGYEYGNYTNPLDPDTDNDLIWDYDEINGTLGYVTSPIKNDTDDDKIRDDLEYSYHTNPLVSDTDGDNFNDYDEIFIHNTNATDILWYPMPNLFVSGFHVSPVNEGQPFVLNFTITNNGIWSAEGIIIIIRCEPLDKTLYNNTNSPFNLSIDQTRSFLVDCSAITNAGNYVLTLVIDPDNLINEKYSSKDGSLRSNWDDNTEQTTMRIIAKGGLSGNLITTIVIISITIIGSVIGVIVLLIFLKPRFKKIIFSKKQKSVANLELETFINNIRSFITQKLEEHYELEWWEKGIPDIIQNIVENQIKSETKFIPKTKLQYVKFLELDHFYPIISEKRNWNEIFTEIYPDKNTLKENFENLIDFKNKLSQNIITPEEINKSSIYIHGIMSFITKGFNIFLSYSTKDSDHFQIPEIVNRLKKFPKIEKVLYWEADSGEDIVKYMERALKISKVFVLFCTENSIKSKAVEDEWEAAFQMRKKSLMKIVPVYENEEIIPFLLTPLLNVKYTKDDFDGFIQKLYEEITR